MREIALRLLIHAVAITITAGLLSGITIRDNSPVTLLIVALIFGIVNSLVKPIITVLTCPLVFFTLGLFLLVINGMMLLLTDELSGGRLEVADLGTAILGGIIMGVVGMILENALDLNRRREG